ncbi:MAG TPA: radical SAM protein [Thermoanaerobaculia bacterium]|jgi:radical SAM superfamily enzyme YgiQ (UPF0313 family)
MKIFLVSVPLELPLANYCLAAQLSASPETRDCEIEILNLDTSRLNEYNRKSVEIWRYVARVEAARPDVVAFSVYLWNDISVRELVAITARLYPEISILVGGPELATPEAARSWVEGGRVTAAIRGEGEITLVEVVERLGRGEDLSGVRGCTWWNGDSVVHEPPRPPVGDLSLLASPYLTGWIPDDFFDRDVTHGKGTFPRALVETYRGCYMQCSYCQWGNGSKLRFEFPQDRVREELSWILSRRVSKLWIVDAMFGYKKQLAKDLLRHIVEEKRRHGARTGIVCYHNQDFYDPELFELYREADVSVEVDLQSTSREVLTRVGRMKWYVDSFDRHLDAFRQQAVPTTGSSDLIIGLPGDRLSSFAESVDFLLRRNLKLNLYQTCMIPDTPMSRSAREDGAVFSPIPPRAVFRNGTFPVHEMVAARLIGHGVDFFRRYPKTARLLWHLGFERPVDLCQRLGELLWQRYELMYGESHSSDTALAAEQDRIAEVLPELCPRAWLLPIARDLFRLEGAAARLGARDRPVLAGSVEVPPRDESWLDARPRFRREAVEEVSLRYRVDRALNLWNRTGEVPPEESWRGLAEEPTVALAYLREGGRITYRMIDQDFTHPLLLRFSGYFSVAACLDNLSPDGRFQDLSTLWDRLAGLAQAGLLEPGLACPQEYAAELAAPSNRPMIEK